MPSISSFINNLLGPVSQRCARLWVVSAKVYRGRQTEIRIWVILALDRFGLSCVDQFLGWVILALVGGSLQPIFFEAGHFGLGRWVVLAIF